MVCTPVSKNLCMHTADLSVIIMLDHHHSALFYNHGKKESSHPPNLTVILKCHPLHKAGNDFCDAVTCPMGATLRNATALTIFVPHMMLQCENHNDGDLNEYHSQCPWQATPLGTII